MVKHIFKTYKLFNKINLKLKGHKPKKYIIKMNLIETGCGGENRPLTNSK